MAFDMNDYIERHREWSREAFGEGRRTGGLLEHIRSELDEIAQDPTDIYEWIDLIILALDGAWRAGHSPEAIVAALEAKQEKNIAREWPPPPSEDEPSYHVRRGPQPGTDEYAMMKTRVYQESGAK